MFSKICSISKIKRLAGISWLAGISFSFLLLGTSGCSKKSFDINEPNPNTPSSLSPDYILPAALNQSAFLVYGGNSDFAEYWMGYWAVYGITSSSILTYNITTDFFSGNWDDTYVNLENYRTIEAESYTGQYANFLAISKIMKSYHFQRLVDLYNNVPYSDALNLNNHFPKFDSAQSIYKDLIVQLDSAISIIGSAGSLAEIPVTSDILFHGSMDKWVKFANTLKLKILLRQTEMPGGLSYISAHLTGLSSADFLDAGEDAAINPGYTNSSTAQQNPQWQDIGYSTNGAPSGNNQSYRANTYAVSFYFANNDTFRVSLYYAPNDNGIIKGRVFGSSDQGQNNSVISGIGSGILQSAGMNANIIPAFESLFLQSEAAERGLLPDDPGALYKAAVTESFRLLGVADYQDIATAYYSQSDNKVNFDLSSDKLYTIIQQKWAALNGYDPVEAWCDWRRLGIPSDLPISVYPGTTTTHIPYRLLYPSSEYSYNAANVKAQGTINQFTSKVFWMP